MTLQWICGRNYNNNTWLLYVWNAAQWLQIGYTPSSSANIWYTPWPWYQTIQNASLRVTMSVGMDYWSFWMVWYHGRGVHQILSSDSGYNLYLETGAQTTNLLDKIIIILISDGEKIFDWIDEWLVHGNSNLRSIAVKEHFTVKSGNWSTEGVSPSHTNHSRVWNAPLRS